MAIPAEYVLSTHLFASSRQSAIKQVWTRGIVRDIAQTSAGSEVARIRQKMIAAFAGETL
ncbi:MAG: hypothetical protein E6853_22210, partial [Enterobacter sp.]